MTCNQSFSPSVTMTSQWTLTCLLLLLLTTVAFAIDVHNLNIDEYLNYVNPPAVQKFQNEHGDTILCVLYADQISLRGSEQRSLETRDERKTKLPPKFTRFDVKRGCPEDTVPILETKRENVERAGSVTRYINSHRKIMTRSAKNLSGEIRPSDVGDVVHEYDVVTFVASAPAADGNGPIYQVRAGLNVWKPNVDINGRGIYSAAEIWVQSSDIGEVPQAIFAGWEVNPGAYAGDIGPRFFTSWTADGNQNTGCRNQDCPGFVLAPGATNYLGARITPVSTYTGNQQQIIVKFIIEDFGSNDTRWTLYFDGERLGWWPGSLFKNLSSGGVLAGFGGEVSFLQRKQGSPLSKTEMGSGHFPLEGYRRSAHIRDIKILNYTGMDAPVNAARFALRPFCYDVSDVIDDDSFGKHIFFGGPGGNNASCVF